MDNINIQIRPARKSDIPAISALLQASFADYYNILGVKIKTANETHDEIKKDIEEKNVHVATANNFLLIGSIRYNKVGDVCYISRFGVLPKWQATGTGGMLLMQAESYCKDKNIKAMALHTATKLSKQIRYYYGQGFFIHSTTFNKGYIRGLLIKEFGVGYSLDRLISNQKINK